MLIAKEELLKLRGVFTWSFGFQWHISTSRGNFQWNDPDYGGNNVIFPCLPYGEWLKNLKIEFGRDKGIHIIGEKCGQDIIFVDRN